MERRKDQSSSSPSKQQRPTPNEYFAAIMTTLEAQDQCFTPELVYLLDMVIGHVEPSVLRAKFKPISGVLLLLLRLNMEHDMTAFVRDLVSCLGKLLLAQDVSKAFWNSPAPLKTFYILLNCFRTKRPKIRKAAMLATKDLLHLHADHSAWALSTQVVDFSTTVLEACTSNDSLPTLHLLGFLQEALPYLSTDGIEKLVHQILKLQQSSELPLVVQTSLQTLQALVKSSSEASSRKLSSRVVSQVLEGVLGLQFRKQDVQISCVFCVLVATCIDRLNREDAKATGHVVVMSELLPRATAALVCRCESDSPLVHKAACSALRMASYIAKHPFVENDKVIVDVVAASMRLLEYRYQASWQDTLPFLGSLFIDFKKDGGSLLDPLLKRLDTLYEAVRSSAPDSLKPFQDCIAMAIDGLGMEQVLGVLPIEDEHGSPCRNWLLGLLSSHGKRQPSRLAYFQGPILDMAKGCHEIVASEVSSAKKRQFYRQRVLQLWGLLPAFCAHPLDIPSSFRKCGGLMSCLATLAPVLAKALQDANYPELLPIVCQSLQNLANFVQEQQQDQDQEAQRGPYKTQDAETLENISKKFLPILFNMLDNTSLDDSSSRTKVSTLSQTISAFALIAPKPYVASLFKKLVQKLLEATLAQEDRTGGISQAGKAAVLCELALALVPCLDQQGMMLLYKVIRPLIRLDKDLALQKRAYRVLAALCEHHGERFLLPDILEDLASLLADSLLTCHVSARQMRLGVLEFVVKALDGEKQEHVELLASLVGEVLLCLKDANGKARQAAYRTLSVMAQVKDEDDMAEFSKMVLAALAAETSHVRSAAVLALAHLIFEYAPKSPAFRQSIPDLLSTVLCLADDPSKEVIKSVVSFIRIAAVACPVESLHPLLPGRPTHRAIYQPLHWADIIACLFSSKSKIRFRAKIKIILKKLCRKFGYDQILSLAPDTDKKLVHHIQKQALRGDRISAAAASAELEDEEEVDFEAMINDEDDDDDDQTDVDGRSLLDDSLSRVDGEGRKKRRRKAEVEDLRLRGGGGIVDLLDPSMIKNLKIGSGGKKRSRMGREGEENLDDDEDVLRFNEEGKLIVQESKGKAEGIQCPRTPILDLMDLGEDAIESDDGEEEQRRRKGKRAKGLIAAASASSGGKKAPGAAYKNKKAGGDVKRKGQLEPYAYIPLNGKINSKRLRGEAVKTFGSVFASKKKGGRQNSRKGSRV